MPTVKCSIYIFLFFYNSAISVLLGEDWKSLPYEYKKNGNSVQYGIYKRKAEAAVRADKERFLNVSKNRVGERM